jgi:diguanylate cyclase (GGDEF)-like protein
MSLLSPAFSLPIAFLLLQCALFGLLPNAISAKAAYIFMVAAPALAAVAALRRGLRERASARLGWLAIVTAFAIWAVGAFGNLWQEMVLGRLDEMYRESILAFNLAIVPVTFLLAGEWNDEGRRIVRFVDASLALALGYGYFIFTWSMLTARGAPDEAGVRALVWLMDAQNLFVAIGALIRWSAAQEGKERELFRALAAYTAGYFVIAFVNNHFIATNPDFGPQAGSIVTLVFALAACLALLEPTKKFGEIRSSRFARTVHSASPLFLAGTLLLVSLFLIRSDYVLGAAGVIIAVVGYGLRSTVTQVRHIEHDDAMRRNHSELQRIAWTDALTGVSNRRFFDQALVAAWRSGLRTGQSLAVLMIDIDHFKQLNDHYGHLVGDARLREVAMALKQALARSGDVLARYGGEEFVALLMNCSAAEAADVAERLRAAVEALGIQNIGSPLGRLTVSIGTSSLLPMRRGGASSIVDSADKALYRAKCAGRNQVKACDEPEPLELPYPRIDAQDTMPDSTLPPDTERRGPHRAKNVLRPDFGAERNAPGAGQTTGTRD